MQSLKYTIGDTLEEKNNFFVLRNSDSTYLHRDRGWIGVCPPNCSGRYQSRREAMMFLRKVADPKDLQKKRPHPHNPRFILYGDT